MKADKMNVRQMQALAAIYLAAFCCKVGIKHNTIAELIQHLLSMLRIEDLSIWEQNGATLELSGRGDPLPADLQRIINKSDLESFSRLVDSTVEVGMVDMYGAPTDEPRRFLNECKKILEYCGVCVPSEKWLIPLNQGNDAWGQSVEKSEFDKVLGRYVDILGDFLTGYEYLFAKANNEMEGTTNAGESTHKSKFLSVVDNEDNEF